MDQMLEIHGLAKDLEDGYVIAECEEMKNILQRNYDSRQYLSDMFEDAGKDYDSMRTRIDFVLNHLEKTGGEVPL